MKFDNSSAWRRRAHVCVAVILAALLTLSGTGLPNLWAGSNKWISIGPFPFVGSRVQSLAIDPHNPGTLYAGTGGGVFKSTDNGASWISINSAIPVFSLAIDPRTPGTLYAGSYGVFKSIDGGVNWSQASWGLSTSTNLQDGAYWDVGALAIDPQDPDTLYAGTEGGGLFKSENGGASWKTVGSGLPSLRLGLGISINLHVYRLAIDPQNRNTVYAVASYLRDIGGGILVSSTAVFKTTDAGAHWSALIVPSSGPNNSISTLVMDPQKPATLYVLQSGPPALIKSTDGGASWSTVSATIAASGLAIDPQSSNTLYVSTVSGLLKSTDGGASWIAASSGLPGGVGLLVMDPQHPGTVYASSLGGLFKTTDGGTNWTPVNAALLGSTLFVPALLIDPRSSSIYAGTGAQLFVESTDGGSNWISINASGPYFSPSALAIDPQNPRTLYAGGSPGAIFKSPDGGSTWSAAFLPGNFYFEINALAIDPKNPNTIYAGTSHGVFKSSDAGGSWTASNFGLPRGYFPTVVIDPRNPSTVYAGGSGGVFKSTDSGGEWSTLGFPTDFASVLAIDPQNPSAIYAGSFGAIFKSIDSGTNWSAASAGLSSNANWVSALVIDPQNPSTLYAGTSGMGSDGSCNNPCSGFNDGVFKSTDAGATWTALNAGLTTTHVFSLAIDPQNPNRLYAGTLGGGVFAISFGLEPVVTDLRFDRTNVVAGGSYAVTVSGSSLTPQTFFDVRFSAPGSSASDVVLNWQKGLVVSHNVPADIAAGSWTINGIRAHELEADHRDSFVPVSATITISH